MARPDDPTDRALTSRTIAIPESREADALAKLLEAQGAAVVRCPLIAIGDNPDRPSVERWLDQLIAGQFDEVIFYTGEGIRRLLALADRNGKRERAIDALACVRKLTRGPKPIRALREIGLNTDAKASPPTTSGIIDLIHRLDLRHHRVGVQLFGQQPNPPLSAALRLAGAEAYCVWPYVYASQADDQRVGSLIHQLVAGAIDLIAFTSSAQVERLISVASKLGQTDLLADALGRSTVAALGPVVAGALRQAGLHPHIELTGQYAMKPMVRTIVAAMRARPTADL